MNFDFDFNQIKIEILEFKSVFPLTILFLVSALLTVLLQGKIRFMVIFAFATLFLGFWIVRHLILPNDKKVKKIFIELKDKGAIEKTREIRCDKRVQAFKSGLFLYNTIFYDKKSCNLDEDTIRFALLHEEGHKVNKQYLFPPLFFLLTLILIPVVFYTLSYEELNSGSFFLSLLWFTMITCYSLVFVVSMINNLIEPSRYDEYRSDEFAAKMLKEKLNFKRPSIIVDNSFKALRKQIEETDENLDSFKNRLIYAFARYHPLDEDRVKNIYEKFDEKV
jgi:Zn-dependent protease with chaperone function